MPPLPCGDPICPGIRIPGKPAASGSSGQLQATDNATAPHQSLAAAKAAFLARQGKGRYNAAWMEKHYAAELGARLGPGQHYLDFTGVFSPAADAGSVCVCLCELRLVGSK